MVKTAVILAAGLGTRFGKYTELVPKGFVEFKGKPMVVRSIETLIACGIQKIIIGTGYHREYYERLAERYPQVQTCFSPRYAETNSMYTLYQVRELVGENDFLLLESDLVFEEKAIRSLLDDQREDVLLITPVTKFQDQYYVEADARGVLTACSVHPEELNYQGEFVGIHKLSARFYQQMCRDYALKVEEQPKLGYEYELLHMSQHLSPLYVLKVDRLQWYEIDDPEDLRFAEENLKID